MIVCLIWLGSETEVEFCCWVCELDVLAMLLELAMLFCCCCCCWLEAPLIASCNMGVEDWSRLRFVLVDCGEVEPTEEAEEEDAELLADEEASELFVELLLFVEETVTTFCGELPWKTVVIISWLPSPAWTLCTIFWPGFCCCCCCCCC